MLEAEKRCRKIRAGQVPFSPRVNTAGAGVRFLSKALDRKKGRKVSSRYFQRLQRKANLCNYPWCYSTVEDIQDNLKKARRRYQLIKPQA
jgi:hypothetical protein